ncbi:MAG TPA: ComEC/Rec2 family competence protein, partial [Myxococcota bacterium]|nr:ComEC/Rec2 family competence protein [Myxococcota bacterium]
MRAGAPLLAAAFALGLVVGDRWPGIASVSLVAAALACAASLALRARPPWRALVALVATAAAGAALMGSRVAPARASLAQPRRDAVIEARVARVERFTSATRLELERAAWVLPVTAGPARVRASLPPGAPPPPAGARVRAALRTRPLRPGVANPGGADPTRAPARAGIGRVADVTSPALVEIVERPSANPAILIANRRSAASAALRRAGRGGALLAALALGDQEGIPERDRRAWAALGIAHLLSVSGLHLALAAGAAYALAARALRRAARLCERGDTRRAALAFGVLAA